MFLISVLFSPLQYLNVKLNDISVPDPDKYPHMVLNTLHPLLSVSHTQHTCALHADTHTTHMCDVLKLFVPTCSCLSGTASFVAQL